jgi:hypothetical protein
MSKEFFSRLSQSCIDILNDEKHHDITIEVGEDFILITSEGFELMNRLYEKV